MTYDDVCEGVSVTYEEAQAEVIKHNTSWSEFLEDNGSQAYYSGKLVLDWLGY